MISEDMSELRKVLKEEYVIWCKNNGGRSYLSTLYAHSTSTTTNIDDAMKLKNSNTAKAAAMLATSLETSKEFHVSHIQTIIEDIPDSIEEEDL